MRGRILFVAGLAAGYVVGARAGRSAYDTVVERVKGVAESPKVQQLGDKAKQTLEQKAPKVADVAGKAAGTASAAASAAAEAGAASSDDSSIGEQKQSTPPTPTPPSPAGDGSVA